MSSAAHARDLLTERNGGELTVKMGEITPIEAKYRRTDNPDGPLISVGHADVFLIRHANGSKELFNAQGPLAPPNPTSPLRLGRHLFRRLRRPCPLGAQ